MTDLSRGARASAQRPQAGLAAADGVAGARHRGEFRTGVHQPGGVAEARGHPGVVGRGGGGVRVGHLSPAKRRRPGQGARSEAGLRLAAGPGDLGTPRIRADGGNAAAPRADLRDTRPGRRRGRRPAGRTGRAAGQSGDSVRRRPVAPARDRDRSEPRYSDWTRDTETTGRVDRQPDRHRGPRGPDAEHRGEPDHRCACRTPSARR